MGIEAEKSRVKIMNVLGVEKPMRVEDRRRAELRDRGMNRVATNDQPTRYLARDIAMARIRRGSSYNKDRMNH